MTEKNLTNPLSSRFTEALTCAAEWHQLQARKETEIPYVSHLLGVASLALEHGATEDEAIAALLHDAVEDQGGTARAAVIRARFGNAVTEIVLHCTDAETLPKPEWRVRKEKYIAHMRNAPPSVQLVSACDKVHNARAILNDYRQIGEALWDRFTAKRDGTLWYYRALVEAFASHGAKPIEELDRVVTELEKLSHEATKKA